MNEAIANIAKNCLFDAAHYTWVYISRKKLTVHDNDVLRAKLLAHGDYAAPLGVKYVKQPFENIAVVLGFEDVNHANKNLMFTFDCRDSMLYEAHMWGSFTVHNAPPKGVDPRVVSLLFRAKPELYEQVPEPDKTLNPTGKRKEELVLVDFPNDMTQELRQQAVDTMVPIMQMLAIYIPCASDGLLEGEEIDYYRPKNTGNNEKRKRKGKAALYEWSTVTLERKRHGLPSAPKGGTHASPRLHQRRGHWVTSKLGKRFWRAEAVVGKAENGMLFHDYKTTE